MKSWRTFLGRFRIAIIHYPVYDKNGDVVATSVTNMEIHDIARTCMTFDVDLCYIVSPLAKQRAIMEKLIHHWRHGFGSTYNPLRGEALARISIVPDLETAVDDSAGGRKPLVVGTSSRARAENMVGYQKLNELIEKSTDPVLLLFGTGWGLTDETVARCDKMLEPIRGKADYNHLSLRVALGIILDRIFGERGGKNERDD